MTGSHRVPTCQSKTSLHRTLPEIGLLHLGHVEQLLAGSADDDPSALHHEGEIRDRWKGLGPVKQSGIRCKDPIFWAFLEERLHYQNINNEARAAGSVRAHCRIDSRRELNENPQAAALWHSLDTAFHAWKLSDG